MLSLNGYPARFRLLAVRIVDEVLPIDHGVVENAKQNTLAYHHASARDCIHLAIMQKHGLDRILTFDSGFDNFPGIARVS